jgi:DNA-binding winged helix-turn-helix (wHTH) protein
MQRRNRRTKHRQTASRRSPSRWSAIKANNHPLSYSVNRSGSATADGALQFGHVRVLLRQRQLLADGVRLELGTRAFDLLLVLLEANGSPVTKEERLGRIWPGIVVSEGNLKVQVSALRRALGVERSAIRTEGGRGYRFTGVLCSTTAVDAYQPHSWAKLPSARSLFSILPRAYFPIPPRNGCYCSERPPRSPGLDDLKRQIKAFGTHRQGPNVPSAA